MMKRRICFLALLLLCLAACPVRAQIESDCGLQDCVCFIQLGDEGIAVKGIISLLAGAGYLQSDRGSTFTEQVYDAVCAFQEDYGLATTGQMDDDTLTLLIWGMNTQELNAAQPQSNPDAVWVPTNGGTKRHSKPTCSGMQEPRKMSVRNAQALGLEACKKCKPD